MVWEGGWVDKEDFVKIRLVVQYVFNGPDKGSFWARLDLEKGTKRIFPCQDCTEERLGRCCRKAVRDHSCGTVVAKVTFRGRVFLDLSEHFRAVGVK